MTIMFGKNPNGPGSLFTGLSTDTKPDATHGSGTMPCENDLFFETDTKNQFIYVGLAWTAYGSDVIVTPSGTQNVNIIQTNGVTQLAGAGATGTGSERVTVAQDTTTVAGSAPGTAGAASANVVTVQGVASMTPVQTNLTQINGTALLAGTGAQAAGSPRVTVATDTATIAGSAVGTAGTPSTNVVSVQGVASGTVVPVSTTNPAAAAILVGRQTFTSTTGATTLITITAGKTWVGTIGASVSCQTAAATATVGLATATFTTTGAGCTPAAGTYLVVSATNGANAATGTVGSQAANFGSSSDFVVNCASGTCTIAVASTNTGTASLVDAFAHGVQT